VDDPANFQLLCSPCHVRKTREQRVRPPLLESELSVAMRDLFLDTPNLNS
jgi:hypothetical protein